MTQITDNNVKWIMAIGSTLLLVALGLVGLSVKTIYGSGMMVERLNNHIEAGVINHHTIDGKLKEQREITNDLQMLINSHILLDKVGFDSAIEEKRIDLEKKQPPIYAGLGGEEA